MLGLGTKVPCVWRQKVRDLAPLMGPDKQGALDQMRRMYPRHYDVSQANVLGQKLGVHPMYITCWCCMVRPLAKWDGHPRFNHLSSTDDGHAELLTCAKEYRKYHKFWPTPAWVFEKVLGPPSQEATLRELTGSVADNLQQHSWVEKAKQGRPTQPAAAALPLAVPGHP